MGGICKKRNISQLKKTGVKKDSCFSFAAAEMQDI
jgi:hypothetical protein